MKRLLGASPLLLGLLAVPPVSAQGLGVVSPPPATPPLPLTPTTLADQLAGNNSMPWLERRLWWWWANLPEYSFRSPYHLNRTKTLPRALELATCESTDEQWMLSGDEEIDSSLQTIGKVALAEPGALIGAAIVLLSGLVLLMPTHWASHGLCHSFVSVFSCGAPDFAGKPMRQPTDTVGAALLVFIGLASAIYHAIGSPIAWLCALGARGLLLLWYIYVWTERVARLPILLRALCALGLPVAQLLALRLVYPLLDGHFSALNGHFSGFQRWPVPILYLSIVAVCHFRLTDAQRLQPLGGTFWLCLACLAVSADGPTCDSVSSALGYRVGLLPVGHVLSALGFSALICAVRPRKANGTSSAHEARDETFAPDGERKDEILAPGSPSRGGETDDDLDSALTRLSQVVEIEDRRLSQVLADEAAEEEEDEGDDEDDAVGRGIEDGEGAQGMSTPFASHRLSRSGSRQSRSDKIPFPSRSGTVPFPSREPKIPTTPPPSVVIETWLLWEKRTPAAESIHI